MNNILLPSLSKLSLVKLSTLLWKSMDFDVDKYTLRNKDEFQKYIKRQFELKGVEQKICKLQLPESLKLEVLSFIQEMLLQMLRWKMHLLLSNITLSEPVILTWTCLGTVDSKETIKMTMKYTRNSCLYKYRIACTQCLEDDIVLLWEELESDDKDLDKIEDKENYLVVYWSYKITNNLDQLSDYAKLYSGRDDATPCEVALEYAARKGFDVATRYFFEILNTESKEEILESTAHKIVKLNIPHVTVLVIFLSKMSQEKQLKVFEDSYHNVLISLLDWPTNDLFLEVASYMWDLLSPMGYYEVLAAIFRRTENLRYENLFHTLWQRSSEKGRCKVLTMLRHEIQMLHELVVCNRREIIKHIFHYASSEDKANIIFGCEGLIICKELVHTDKWDELKFFVQQCLSSKKDVMKMRAYLTSWNKELAHIKVRIEDLFSTLVINK